MVYAHNYMPNAGPFWEGDNTEHDLISSNAIAVWGPI